MSRKKGKREAAPVRKGGAGKAAFANRWNKWAKIMVISLCSVLALVVTAVTAWRLLVVPPDVSQTSKPDASQTQSSSSGTATEKPEQEQEPESETVTVNQRKEDYFTFLLLGKDTSSESTDTIILVSYDVPNGTVNCMSIPRDTMVNVYWDIKKINSVYSSKLGLDGLKEQVYYLTGIMPDCHVIIEWAAVGELVDALDGIYFDVPYDMDYDDDWQDLHIHQEKGYRLLSGDDAMQVIRWRGNNNDSPYGYHKEDGGVGDTGRMAIQQNFLKAVAKQCLQLGNWTKISAFAEIFANNIETDLSIQNILWFAEKAMGVDLDNVRFMTLPSNPEGWAYSYSTGGNQSYAFAYPDQVVEMVNEYFNPWLEDITEEDLQIMGKNKDGSLYVTNGTLMDEKAAQPPVKKPSSGSSSGTSGSTSGSAEKEPEEPALPAEQPPADSSADASEENLPEAPVEDSALPDEEEKQEEPDRPEEPEAADDSVPPDWL